MSRNHRFSYSSVSQRINTKNIPSAALKCYPMVHSSSSVRRRPWHRGATVRVASDTHLLKQEREGGSASQQVDRSCIYII